MALIECPFCGQPVSEKAVVCPHCKRRIVSVPAARGAVCPECGAQYPAGRNSCPACGCPCAAPSKGRQRIAVAAAVFSILLVAAVFLCIFGISQWKASVYSDTLETATYTMLDGAVDAETAGNLIIRVWHNSIYRKHDTSTDKYTIVNGMFLDDFNDALDRLFADKSFQATLSAIRHNQEEAAALMKRLGDPPKEHEEAYSALKDYYRDYLAFTNAVCDPVGSLNTFSEAFDRTDSDCANAFREMQLYLEP